MCFLIKPIACENPETVTHYFGPGIHYPNLLEVVVPLADGSEKHMTDYASAGKRWTEESKMAAWILTK